MTTVLAWQDRAACRGMGWALFFGTEAERYDQEARRLREERAVAVCGTCPVRTECLEYALERPERSGAWGGLTEGELRGEHRRRQRRDLAARRRAGEAA